MISEDYSFYFFLSIDNKKYIIDKEHFDKNNLCFIEVDHEEILNAAKPISEIKNIKKDFLLDTKLYHPSDYINFEKCKINIIDIKKNKNVGSLNISIDSSKYKHYEQTKISVNIPDGCNTIKINSDDILNSNDIKVISTNKILIFKFKTEANIKNIAFYNKRPDNVISISENDIDMTYDLFSIYIKFNKDYNKIYINNLKKQNDIPKDSLEEVI